MRRYAKKRLTKAVSLLPKGFRHSVAMQLGADGTIDYRSFTLLAKKFNVEALTVRGEYGAFSSTIEDLSILGVYAATGTWATKTNDLLRDFFARAGTGTYIDVGANVGLTVVPIAQNPNVRCYALEPEPTNFQNLLHNLRANTSHDNVTALQTAAFKETTTLEFEIDVIGNLGDHRIHLQNEPGDFSEDARRTIEVPAAPLDSLIPVETGPLAVKIDTQGAEPFVIEGGRKTLRRADLLIMEFWPYGMARLSADPEIVYDYLKSQFSAANISRESRPIKLAAPIDDVIATLRGFVETKTRDGYFYVDVVASR